MMVNVAPLSVPIDCGKPVVTPPLITGMPPTVRVCKPSGAVTVKVPVWVSAAESGSVP